MGVAREDLLRTAALAQLRLLPDEIERLEGQLNGILGHIEQLLGIDVDPTSAAPFSLPPAPAGRDDVPAADPLERALPELAPEWRDGYFTVPRVIAP